MLVVRKFYFLLVVTILGTFFPFYRLSYEFDPQRKSFVLAYNARFDNRLDNRLDNLSHANSSGLESSSSPISERDIFNEDEKKKLRNLIYGYVVELAKTENATESSTETTRALPKLLRPKPKDAPPPPPLPTPSNTLTTQPTPNFTGTEIASEKVAIVTLYDDTKEKRLGGIIDVSIANKQYYAEKHGYPFFVDNHMWVNKSKPVAWSKLLAVRERLNQYEWVMWVDLDTLYMNMEIRLQSLLDSKYDLIVTKDDNGLNSGVMLWRNTSWSRDLLQEAYEQDQFVRSNGTYEQRAIVHVLKQRSDHNDHVKYLSQDTMNSYTNYHSRKFHAYKKGEFMVHLAGCRHLRGCSFTELYLKYAKVSKDLNRLHGWKIPISPPPSSH